MLLTTHFLDESEVLSDHVAILSKGTLRAEGTVATLKSSFGGGYKVVLPNNTDIRSRSEDIPASVARHGDYNSVVYEAPDSAALTQLVSLLTQSRISQYTIHGPSIEDVFLGLADEMRTEAGNENEMTTFECRQNSSASMELKPQHSHVAVSKSARLQSGKGCGPLKQTWILFLKRLIVLKHNYMPYFGALFVPLVLAGSGSQYLFSTEI
jgi:ATP-binding cassette, subfamily A (ABC1), member 3